jgi:porin
MSRILAAVSILILSGIMNVSNAETPDLSNSITQQNASPNIFPDLAESGIEVIFGLTSIYQQNIHGGLSTHRRAGRLSGSYDLEITSDIEKLLGFRGGTLFVHIEGGWPDTQGIDAASVGSVFSVNADAMGNRTMDVTELWYEQSLLDGTFLIRIGKMDLTAGFEHNNCPVAFDCSIFANDETSQFLNGALVNNPTIPFPDYALGVAGFYSPIEWWYISAGVVDAQNDARETGFRTTFHKEDYFFYVFETGLTPQLNSENGSLQGAYRIGLWNDPQPKTNSDGTKNYRDDVGFYISCGQMLCKEIPSPEDDQGLGVFFRYGYADSRKNDITNFWSAGFQYQGLIEGRDEDVLGLGFAHGIFSNSASTNYPEDYESALEIYYNAQVTPWLNISPSIQYITNPSNPANPAKAGDAVVTAIRAQMSF